MNQDKVIGLAYWGQIDYLGESQGWPAKGWAQGAFDLSLQPKPIAYLLRSMFSDEPVVHIGVIDDDKSDVVWNDVQVGTARMSENWNRKPDTKATINVYTNCDKVVLRLNGKVVAEKENTLNTKGRNKLRIDDIMYQPGTLEAIGYKDGKPVASHKIMTAGKIQRRHYITSYQDAITQRVLLHVHTFCHHRFSGRHRPLRVHVLQRHGHPRDVPRRQLPPHQYFRDGHPFRAHRQPAAAALRAEGPADRA
jgi:hypothetical protein